MRVMLAGATNDRQYVKSYRSFRDIKIREGDIFVEPESFSRGDIVRMTLCDEFLESKEYDAILMLDLDMIHPPDLLERLREHDLDMVTAHYYKRRTPMESIIGVGNAHPYFPLTDFPEEGLMEVSTTGFGNVLIKREVIERVKEVIPYGEHPFAIGPVPEMANGEIAMGSDLRFFHYARKLGYKLWLDCGVESLHACNVWLSRALYKRLREPDFEATQVEMTKQAQAYYAKGGVG